MDTPTKAESAIIRNVGAATERAAKRLETTSLRVSDNIRKLTPEVKMMLADLVAHGRGFVKSCKTLGFTSQSAYAELKRDPSFRALIDAARVAAKEGIEESLYERACRSDTTAGIFLLKAMDPDRYSERMRVEGVHRVEINVSLIPAEEALDATGVEAEVVDAEYSEDSL